MSDALYGYLKSWDSQNHMATELKLAIDQIVNTLSMVYNDGTAGLLSDEIPFTQNTEIQSWQVVFKTYVDGLKDVEFDAVFSQYNPGKAPLSDKIPLVSFWEVLDKVTDQMLYIQSWKAGANETMDGKTDFESTYPEFRPLFRKTLWTHVLHGTQFKKEAVPLWRFTNLLMPLPSVSLEVLSYVTGEHKAISIQQRLIFGNFGKWSPETVQKQNNTLNEWFKLIDSSRGHPKLHFLDFPAFPEINIADCDEGLYEHPKASQIEANARNSMIRSMNQYQYYNAAINVLSATKHAAVPLWLYRIYIATLITELNRFDEDIQHANVLIQDAYNELRERQKTEAKITVEEANYYVTIYDLGSSYVNTLINPAYETRHNFTARFESDVEHVSQSAIGEMLAALEDKFNSLTSNPSENLIAILQSGENKAITVNTNSGKLHLSYGSLVCLLGTILVNADHTYLTTTQSVLDTMVELRLKSFAELEKDKQQMYRAMWKWIETKIRLIVNSASTHIVFDRRITSYKIQETITSQNNTFISDVIKALFVNTFYWSISSTNVSEEFKMAYIELITPVGTISDNYLYPKLMGLVPYYSKLLKVEFGDSLG